MGSILKHKSLKPYKQGNTFKQETMAQAEQKVRELAQKAVNTLPNVLAYAREHMDDHYVRYVNNYLVRLQSLLRAGQGQVIDAAREMDEKNNEVYFGASTLDMVNEVLAAYAKHKKEEAEKARIALEQQRHEKVRQYVLKAHNQAQQLAKRSQPQYSSDGKTIKNSNTKIWKTGR